MEISNPARPTHKRNASSKSNLLRSLVSPRARPLQSEPTRWQTQSHGLVAYGSLLPPDHPHVGKASALGERHGNIQSPLLSPNKSVRAHHNSIYNADGSGSRKHKTSTNLTAVFAKLNRSTKDLATLDVKDKENASPSVPTQTPIETPIWAQFATASSDLNKVTPPGTSSGRESVSSVQHWKDEIARYTPQEYSPSKQRNFNDAVRPPSLRPRGPTQPPSSVFSADGLVAAVGRRLSVDRTSLDMRRSSESVRRYRPELDRAGSSGSVSEIRGRLQARQVSGSSTEQAPPKDKLNIIKRGGRVMAAVAALQGKPKPDSSSKQELALDPKAVDAAFEAVLDSRNIPEPMRQKMRALTMRVKADFVRQDEGLRTATTSSTVDQEEDGGAKDPVEGTDLPIEQIDNDDGKSTKRSRPRSRTFTFTKLDRRSDGSPNKKQRSRSKSKSRSATIEIPRSSSRPRSMVVTPTTPFGSFGRKQANPVVPSEYVGFLKKVQDPTQVEVGRLHKLRILLRNETVSWVETFLSLGGMSEITSLLHRTMDLEWREDHEDQVLHETLLCLKALCTTDHAMEELEIVANELFPALLGMIFDDEKKGPAEYTTRTIIFNVLFNYLIAASKGSSDDLEQRARAILTYIGEPEKPEAARPIDFVLDMHIPRPYKLWSREITHVTKEVFWIFLHGLNVVPLPKRTADGDASDNQDDSIRGSFWQRHFPGLRPPVPAAPYIGGVEWDATTYLAAHLDLMNGLIASLPSREARNELRKQMEASGFEKVMGSTLRTCKEKYYSGVHDGLRAWVAAAVDDDWPVRFVREGPSVEEQVATAKSRSPKKSSKKSSETPKIEAPKLDLGLNLDSTKTYDVDGWLE